MSGLPTDYPANSYYTASTELPASQPRLEGTIKADVAIVGGGYTGLSAALHLAQRGVNVVVLEAGRLSSGASGRNGGQIHSGQRQDPEWFETRYGLEAAKDYFALGEAGKQLVKDLIADHAIACDLKSGLIHAAHKKRYVAEYQEHGAHMSATYDHPLTWLDADETAERLGTNAYCGALYDPSAGHLHPLKFALGLARAAMTAGALCYENSPVGRLDGKRLVTDHGSVEADTILLCGNGYLSGIESTTEARVMPIHNYIAATRPLADHEVPIPGDECASDSRFVINYWRLSADRRLLFGGGETYSRHFPEDIANFVRKPLSQIYPQFAAIEIDYAWGGTLGVTMHRLPFVKEVRPGVWSAAGFSGQGVTIAPLMGQILAESVLGDRARLSLYEKLPMPAFPGGRLLRMPALVAGMSWYALRDRL